MPISNEGMTVGGSTQSLKPIMVDTHRVTRIEDYSMEGFDWMDTSQYGAPDLAIKVFYDIEGVDTSSWSEEPNVQIYGDLDATRDPSTGQIVEVDGMSGAFKVFEAFTALNVTLEVGAGFDGISAETLREAQGVEFVKLRYAARESGGNVYFNDFDRLFPTPQNDHGNRSMEEIEGDLRNLFLDQYEDGWVDDFQPELIDEDWSHQAHEPNAKTPSGSPSEPSSTQPSSGDGAPDADTFEPDDDLPF